MKKLLLLGAKFSDIPFIKAAHSLGLFVVTTGNDPKDYGHAYANESHLLDYRDVDALERLVHALEIDYIWPSCDDVSLLSTTKLAERLGLPHFDSTTTIETLLDKAKFRALQSELGLPCPYFCYDIFAPLSVPTTTYKDFLIKPTHSHTGYGIASFSSDISASKARTLEAAALKYSDSYVIEEMLAGQNYGFSLLVSSGEIVFYSYDLERHDFSPYAVSATHSTELPALVVESVLKQARAITRHLALKSGILHLQLIVQDNVPHILEATRRCGGDLYALFLEHLTGVPYALRAMELTLGLNEISPKGADLQKTRAPIFLPKSPEDFKQTLRFCIMSRAPVKYDYIDLSPCKAALSDYIIFKDVHEIKEPSKDKAGIAFLDFHSSISLNRALENLDDLAIFRTKQRERK